MAKGADCKSACLRLRRFESYLPHQPSLASQASARQAKLAACGEASEGCRAETRRAKAGFSDTFRHTLLLLLLERAVLPFGASYAAATEKIFCMTYVYILQSVKDPERFYVGVAADLRARLKRHNAGEVSHTSRYVPWTIKTYIAFSEEKQAFAFERYLKSASGRAFAKKRL